LIEAERANYPITRMCTLLGVDRRRYYEWRARQVAGPSARERRDVELTAQIKAFHDASDGTYGAPRIHADLREEGVAISRKKVAALMKDAGIAGISPRTWHPATTVRGADPFPVPDLVSRDFDSGARDHVWLSDITYLRTGQGWAYLCVVRDGHTRRVLGRAIADTLHTDVVEAALRQAVALRGDLAGTAKSSSTLTAVSNTPAHRSLTRPQSSECCAPWVAPAWAGITPPPNRSGRPSRTSTTTATSSRPSTTPDAAPTPGSTAGTTPADATARWVRSVH